MRVLTGKRPLHLATAAALLLTLGGCAYYYDPYYDDYYYRGGYHGADYDVYYDGYYGPYVGGYWADDGYFYYRDRSHRYYRDHDRHFRRDHFHGGHPFRSERRHYDDYWDD